MHCEWKGTFNGYAQKHVLCSVSLGLNTVFFPQWKNWEMAGGGGSMKIKPFDMRQMPFKTRFYSIKMCSMIFKI